MPKGTLKVNIGLRPGSNHLTISQEPHTATVEPLPPLSSNGEGQETDPGPERSLPW